MIIALLVMIGVPVWIVVGIIIAALVSLRRFMAQPDVFVPKSRTSAAEDWPRRASHGRIVHDVLVVHGGVALVRTTVRGIAEVCEWTEGRSAPFVATFDIVFDGGSVEQVAVDAVGAVPLRELVV